MSNTIGQRVRLLREERGWNKSELARRAKVSNTWVTRMEADAYEMPSNEYLNRIAEALRVELREITHGPAPSLTEEEQAEWDAAMSDPEVRYEFATTARSMQEWTDDEKRSLLEVIRQMRDLIDRRRGTR